MANEDLHLAYRPTDLSEVIGQDAIVKSIKSLIKNDALPHSFLFHGGAGIGKTTIARIIASEVDCSPNNIMEFDAASFSGVDAIRNLTRGQQFAGMGDSPNKVYIIDECFIPEVEILTEKGFISFDQLQGELVAQYNNGNISFVPPKRKIKRYHSGRMIRLYSKKLCDITMTPNHDILIKDLDGSDVKYRVDDVNLTQNKYMYVAGKSQGALDVCLTPFEKLDIALQADGGLCINNNTQTLKFSFIKERKVLEFLKLMEEGGFDYNETKGRKNSESGNYIRRFSVFGVNGFTKQLKSLSHLKNISFKKAKEIIEYMVKWDGSINKKTGQYYFSSIDESVVDMYQAIAVLSGYKTNKTIQVDNRKDTFNNVYRLFISKEKDYIECTHIQKQNTHYEGYVYCVSVDSGNIVVRSNGKTLVTGNCHALSKQAWQALLKPIEEPLGHIYFVLCTTELSKVPKTIQSRCHSYGFKEASYDAVMDLLEGINGDEDFDLDDSLLSYIAKQSGGSFRQAIVNLSACRDAKDKKEAAAILDTVADSKGVIDLCRVLIGGKGSFKSSVDLIKLITKDGSVQPESVRIIVLNYMAAVVSKNPGAKDVGRVLGIMDSFSTPYDKAEKIAPLLLSLAEIYFD